MRLLVIVIGNFLITTVVGGFIFGVIWATMIILSESKQDVIWGNLLGGMAFMGIMSSVYSSLIFLLPGLAYSVVIGILSGTCIKDAVIRRRVLIGVSLVAGLTLFPLWLIMSGKGSKEYWKHLA
jgi:hypothetical protein